MTDFPKPEDCPDCHGVPDDSTLCLTCMNQGVLPVRGARLEAQMILQGQGDLSDKLDDIIAEQASQREDLTTALTQIWNKVKNL